MRIWIFPIIYPVQNVRATESFGPGVGKDSKSRDILGVAGGRRQKEMNGISRMISPDAPSIKAYRIKKS